MAQRRMFSQDIVSSDAFLDMPVSSQVLYFHLGIRADDDGFVSPKVVMRVLGSSNDDLKVLLSKRFLLPFESGVVVIKHWLIHNLIRADMYKETLYKKEKSTLGLNDNGAYTELREGVTEIKQIEAPEWLKRRRKDVRTANVPKTAPRLGKDRLGYISESEIRIVSDKEEATPSKETKDLSYMVVFGLFGGAKNYPRNWNTNKTEIQAAKNLLEEHGIEKINLALKFYIKNSDDTYCPQILKPSDLDRKWIALQAYRDKV